MALEAMSSGRPIIATSCGALLDVVEDGVTGFIAPPRDPRGLRDAIRRVMALPREAVEVMAQRAVARVRAEHGWPHRLPALVAVYESASEQATADRQRRAELRALVGA